jgi:hypothetical protein
VRLSSITSGLAPDTRVVVAGGGGGGVGASIHGGNAGSAGVNAAPPGVATGGGGATPTSAGAAGANDGSGGIDPVAGQLGAGGAGGGQNLAGGPTAQSFVAGGGGGGGGMYGGGGAGGTSSAGSGGHGAGGGGGSSGFGQGTSHTSVVVDTTGTPSVTFTYAAAPSNTAAPEISGTTGFGQTLACSQGTWSGTAPISYAYAWLRDGTAIAGETTSNHTITQADAGHAIACRVTATNAANATSATSAPVTPDAAPINTKRPSITGTPKIGKSLTCSPGAWQDTVAFGYSYRWLRGAVPIAGATGAAHTVVMGDRGHKLTCAVTATTKSGFAATATAPPVTIRAGAGKIAVGKVSVKAGSVRVALRCLGSAQARCAVALTLTVGSKVVGKGRVALTAGKHKTVVVQLNTSGLRLLAAKHKLRATLRIAVRGSRRTVTKTVTFTL